MGSGGTFAPAPSTAMPPNLGAPLGSGLGDLFDLTGGVGTLSGSYVAPKTVSGDSRAPTVALRGAETLPMPHPCCQASLESTKGSLG